MKAIYVVALIILVFGGVLLSVSVDASKTRQYRGVTELSKAEAVELALEYSESGSFSFIGEGDPVELVYKFETKSRFEGLEYSIGANYWWLIAVMGSVLVLTSLGFTVCGLSGRDIA